MEATVYWSPGMSLEVLEQIVIQRAFKYYQSNKTATANSLGIAIRTLEAKLDKYDMDEINREAQSAARRNERETNLARARGFSPPNSQTFSGQPAQTSFKTETGVRAQSIANTAAQQQMPVSERQEVQEVLPKQAAAGHSRKSR